MGTEAEWDCMGTMTDNSDSKAIVDELMTSYGEDVWNYAYSITRNREQADDVAQEVFIKAFRKLFTFRSESSIKTWLLAITRNTAFDLKRSAFIRRVTLTDWVEGHLSQAVSPSAEQEAMENEAVSDIWEKVLRLPVKYREVLILFGHHQLSMKEIAHILHISEGTVKSRLHQARLKVVSMKECEENEA